MSGALRSRHRVYRVGETAVAQQVLADPTDGRHRVRSGKRPKLRPRLPCCHRKPNYTSNYKPHKSTHKKPHKSTNLQPLNGTNFEPLNSTNYKPDNSMDSKVRANWRGEMPGQKRRATRRVGVHQQKKHRGVQICLSGGGRLRWDSMAWASYALLALRRQVSRTGQLLRWRKNGKPAEQRSRQQRRANRRRAGGLREKASCR